MKKIPFHKPIMPNSLDEVYSDSIKDGWVTTGSQVKLFESHLSEILDAKYVVAVNSCTAALHLALLAKGYRRGDKFIVPTYTFVATVEVGEYLGMHPILVDCDADYNIDLNQIEDILKKEKNVKAIIPVHFAGKAIDMLEINRLANKYDLFIVEDAAHALETRSNFGKVGDTDHAAAFSFYANKNITTGGEGGALSTNNRSYANKVRKLSLHGMSKDGWKRFKMAGKWQYDVSKLGYKYNMTDIAASFGMWQLEHIDHWYEKRASLFSTYQDSFKKIAGLVCPIPANNDDKHAYHLYIIRLKPSKWAINRNRIIELLNKGGIGTSVHYIPIHMHSYYQNKYGFSSDDFPNAKQYSENVITLPLYPLLKDEDINYIIQFVTEIWENHKL